MKRIIISTIITLITNFAVAQTQQYFNIKNRTYPVNKGFIATPTNNGSFVEIKTDIIKMDTLKNGNAIFSISFSVIDTTINDTLNYVFNNCKLFKKVIENGISYSTEYDNLQIFVIVKDDFSGNKIMNICITIKYPSRKFIALRGISLK